MADFTLKCGAVIQIDEGDREMLMRHSWRVNKRGYVARKTTIDGRPGCMLMLHRVMIGAVKGQIVDHINGNPLDNRRENLRFATARENCRNTRKSKRRSSSQFKGVDWKTANHKWRASIWVEGKSSQLHLGCFDDEHEAAHAYNKAAIEHFGDFAVLNPVGIPKEILRNG